MIGSRNRRGRISQNTHLEWQQQKRAGNTAHGSEKRNNKSSKENNQWVGMDFGNWEIHYSLQILKIAQRDDMMITILRTIYI
ncbi:MAG: hypothetical protein KAH62_00550 [Desulfobacula sp.]|nr:hypothetical protein [Desulfobacterales bacterium]MCK5695096.1 hypothetical protein [Desulfobacula sp.]